MKANSEKTKQSKKATRRVLAGVLCGASVLSLVLSLVMPPISQAIANDTQTVPTEETVMGGGSSSESTDVDNTNNGDTENQISDDGEGGETGDDALRAAPLSDDTGAEDVAELADGDANDASAIALSADGEYFELSQSNINDVLGSDEKAGKYRLTEDITYDGMVTLGSGETVIDLYGHKIFHSGVKNSDSNLPMFNVPSDSTLTILDSKQADDNKSKQSAEQGKLASVSYSADGEKPLNLTYYVTESSVDTKDSTRTSETTYKHEVAISGAIVGTKADSTMRLINVYAGGTFNLQSGVLTTTKNAKVGSLIYAEEDSAVSMSGGYVCGATSMDHGAGIELGIHNGKGATLNLTGGVIAGNYAPEGGGVYADGSTINMTGDTTGGTISGNGTFVDRSGYGAGICAKDSMVTILNGYITNNNYQFYNAWEGTTNHLGNGCHGGGGIAAFSKYPGQRKGSLVISGGYITGNYSAEAGGGVYAGAWNQALSGFTFSGGTIASNVAQNSEGGGIRISAPTESVFNVPIGTKAYITNNKTNTDNDWGGGGVFVQGGDGGGVQPASLKIYNALITKNLAWGFGGGFAACPTGKTAITDTNGIAVFGNTDKDGEHRSKGSHSKTADADENKGGQITDGFKTAGHQDLFLIRGDNNNQYIAAVTGQMLGGGAANWTGTIDKTPTSIGKYEGAQAKYMIGLRSDSSVDDQNVAKGLASLYITGNESNVHGGGIMTNGNVVAGSTAEVKVYPKMKLNGTKMLKGRNLKNNEFEFMLLKQNKIVNENGGTSYTVPSFDSNGILQPNRCSVVNTVKNDGNGQFTFDLGEVYADDDLVYYLVEVPGTDKDVAYDKTIYKIDPKVVKDERKSHKVLDIAYTYYRVESVSVTTVKNDGTGARTSKTESAAIAAAEGENAATIKLTSGATFTNNCPSFSWTPKATKVVEGGEMKEFTLQLAKDSKFDNIIGTAVTSGNENKQTHSFLGGNGNEIELKYSLSDIRTNPDPGDSTGGPSKTFKYYVREKGERSTYPHYKFDQSVYELTVVAKDDDAGITTNVTYTQIVDAEGNEIPENNRISKQYGEDTGAGQSLPTFTNTYSTSLPLSGMSGVTLTYLAGAAVLCVAAAWMHIRRKANAKGGERRE